MGTVCSENVTLTYRRTLRVLRIMPLNSPRKSIRGFDTLAFILLQGGNNSICQDIIDSEKKSSHAKHIK